MPVANPILPGCHPDPSVCRVGEDFFLVTSSFSIHPGLPVYRSRDLQAWTLVGHVLVGDSWIEFDGADLSDGAWAPTIRYFEGVFYVVFAVAERRRGATTYLCTATDPSGPWVRSEVSEASGIDPSLFFDEDGRCWFTAARDAQSAEAPGPGEIWLREFDVVGRRLVGPEHVIWHGSVARQWIEAPHLYRRNGRYHLIAAEGGTEYHHAVTAATAVAVTGPYRTDPRSPLLTHRHLGRASAVQNVGHADLFTDSDGRDWAVVLGVRPLDGHHTLGRETFLVPVAWEPTGPVFAPGVGAVVGLPAEIDPPTWVDPEWVSLRGPAAAQIAESAVILDASATALTARRGVPGFLGRRQSAHVFSFRATVDSVSVDGQRAGLVAFQNERHFAAILIEHARGGTRARFVTCVDGVERVVSERPVLGDARLSITSDGRTYSFGVVLDDGVDVVGTVGHTSLSTETAGGFVGVLLGLLNEGAGAPAIDFREIEFARPVSTPAAPSRV